MSVYRDLMKKESENEAKQAAASKGAKPAKPKAEGPTRYPYPQDLMHMVDRVIDAEHQTIAITSARVGEGASFVAKEFAQVLAQNLAKSLVEEDKAKDRVLLVEVRLDKKAEPTPIEGLDADTVMAQTMMYSKNQYPGVDYIAAVPTGQAPLEFVHALWGFNERSGFFSRWRAVVFDLPPVLLHRETLALTRRTDAAFLVVEHSKTKQEVASAAARLIRRGGNLSGAILNKRQMRIPMWLYRII